MSTTPFGHLRTLAFTALLLVLILQLGCRRGPTVNPTPPPTGGGTGITDSLPDTMALARCTPIQLTLDTDTLPGWVVEPLSIWLADSCLAIELYYSGCGPRTTDFMLVASPLPTLIYPPQIRFQLRDTLDGATCMMAIHDTLYFDLHSLDDAQLRMPIFQILMDGQPSLLYERP